MDHPRIETRHWALWGLRARLVVGSHLDYKRQQAWYIEGLSSGYPEERPAVDALGDVTPDDEEIAELIGQSVRRLEQIRPKHAAALKAWWRAFPGASSSVETNCRRLGVSRKHVYNVRDQARYWCEALIELAWEPA